MAVSEDTLKQWEETLSKASFFGGANPSSLDNENFKALNGTQPCSSLQNVWGWFLFVSFFTEDIRSAWPA
eukprot:CAMPEP_0168336108 /NCGR_PEP_ID=MMETSP0213-20121227/11336_1 /TAXON_ID=151035 /ORGANISM="Euplotes harpa, Strain FSP1.4" /LENGTH=69 /DNA_ID=CAMNT_0008341219 /DNA_START=13 /DNA_END=218 /DNA_ORIENTATION=+